MFDIVSRARQRAESYREGGPSSEHTAALLDAMADEIERLHKESDKWRVQAISMFYLLPDETTGKQAREMRDRTLAQLERMARMEEALRTLVAAKDIKESIGPTHAYTVLRDKGWNLARMVLKEESEVT